MRLFAGWCFAAGFVFAAAVTAHAAPSLSASVNASAYATDGWGDYAVAPVISHVSNNVVPLTAQDHVSFPQQATTVTYPVSGESIFASATVGVSAGLGDLHVYTSAQALSDGAHYYYYGSSGADAHAGFTDTLTINATGSHPYGTWVWIHAQLAVDETHGYGPGTQVNLSATLSVNGASAYDSKDESGNPFGLNNSLFYSFGYINEVGSAGQKLDLLGEFRVGSTYTIYGDLTAHVVTNVGNTNYGQLRDSAGLIDASDTSHSYFWADDPTVVMTTGSGASYALPEPGTLALLLLGAAVLRGRRRPV